MAKKQKTNKEVVTEEVTQVVEQPKTKVVEKPLQPKEIWEVKDRIYYLSGDKKPLSRSIRSAGLYWFDKEQNLLFEKQTETLILYASIS